RGRFRIRQLLPALRAGDPLHKAQPSQRLDVGRSDKSRADDARFDRVHVRCHSTVSTFDHLPSTTDFSMASNTATHCAPSRKSGMIVFFPAIVFISSYTA